MDSTKILIIVVLNINNIFINIYLKKGFSDHMKRV